LAISDTPKPVDGTVAEREAYTAARAAAARERDEARLRLVKELGGSASIAREDGYAVLPPPSVPGAAAVAAEANALLDALGEERLTTGKRKAGSMAKKLLPPEAFELDSPYMRFALSEDIVGPISAYLGLVPILNQIDVWYSATAQAEPRSSQLWHLDHADTSQVKVWVHCSDVGADSGPLTILDASTSTSLADSIGYNFGDGYRVSDDQVDEIAGGAEVALTAPAGAVAFVDTSRCFHFGSRVAPGAPARRVFMAQYLTPYAFRYDGDHREEATYRNLAAAGSSELERLLLGAA
jgi:hypothetical protein